jgi:HEAT repeat protein
MKPIALVLVSALVSFVPRAPRIDVDALAPARELAARRYARVEEELAARPLDGLSADQRAERARLLAVLRAYRARADFGVDEDGVDARVPLFVDAAGRRCAVAELLHATGRDDLVAAVEATDNTAWIVDLAHSTALLGWLDEHGLSLEEAARIQGPALPPPRSEPPGEYLGPVDGRDMGGRGQGSAAPRGASTPAGGPPFPGPGVPATTPGQGSSGAAALTEGDGDAWWLWWEYNKIEFLRPNRLLWERGDDAPGRSTTSPAAFARRLVLPVVQRALSDGDPQVRAAAALTLGRIGGADAVDPLLDRLDDASLHVRESAVLGLGATGAPRAQHALLSLARDARLPGSARRLARTLQPLAVVALGIGRRLGFDASIDDALVEITRGRSLPEREPLGVAAMMYQTLAPGEALRELALELARDGSEPVTVRCRAIEALRGATDAETVSALQHLLSGARVELRRSAALALGEARHPLVVPALQTAYDLERDQLTRAFLLVSLGRQGGAAARRHLMEELTEGPKALRPWTALGLGLIARASSGDEEIARLLREGVGREKNSQARAAYWIASGLARDRGALGELAEALSSDAAPRNRMYAAQALALIGGEDARAVLVDRLAHERADLARSALALSLGVLGWDADAAAIADVFTGTSDPTVQGQVASAMAFLGSSEALVRLGSWCGTDDLARATRAAALDGVGMLAGRSEPLRLGEVSRSANFPLFSSWTESMLATTL